MVWNLRAYLPLLTDCFPTQNIQIYTSIFYQAPTMNYFCGAKQAAHEISTYI
jgi:hypothetical protein